LLELELVTRLDHASYLGRELEKAEIALKFNRSYAQDDVF
jgi:dihydropteroate synthase